VSFDGTPAGQACSTAVHESQSRLYENEVGRGRAFWRYWQPSFNAQYGTDESEDDLVRRVTWVEPGLVRTRADEVTYNLHVIVRFEIERDLFRDELEVADIPRVWRQKYKDYLGVHVPGDLDGVLQDVHWANGLFGYFPTYTLGNVYAAQLFDAARREIPGLENAIASGDFKPLRDWMSEKIYRWGRVYTPEQLIENAAGSPVSTSFFIEYLKARYLRQ
jgi:carboxypeptidase Taq